MGQDLSESMKKQGEASNALKWGRNSYTTLAVKSREDLATALRCLRIAAKLKGISSTRI
jgi:hypothetical protein